MAELSLFELLPILKPQRWHPVFSGLDLQRAKWEGVVQEAQASISSQALADLKQLAANKHAKFDGFLLDTLAFILRDDRSLLGGLALAVRSGSAEERADISSITNFIKAELDEY